MRRKNTTKQMMKEYISESLILIMNKKRYEKITIGEITEKAGVNRSTYYRNFCCKEDIIKFYFEQIIYGYLAEYEALQDQSFEVYLQTLFNHFYRYQPALLLIYQNELSYLMLRVLNDVFENRKKDRLADTKDQFQLFFHIGGIYNFLILWFSHGMKETPNELAKISVEMFPKDAKPVLER